MKSAPKPDNESERIRKLIELEILDTLEEQAYDDLTFLAAQICDTPIALVSLVDSDRQWFKSHFGLDARQTPRELAFCAHAILDDHPLIVEDSTTDPRFQDNPLVTGDPHVKFYAGAPLILDNNLRLGTLCVIDNKARGLSNEQHQSLEALARQVVDQLQLRLKMKEMQRLDHAKDEFLSMVSHELRTPLTSIHGSLGLLQHESFSLPDKARQIADIAYRNSGRLLAIVNDILDMAKLEAGKFDIRLQTLNAVELASRAVELNRAYCSQCDCTIDMKQPEQTDLEIVGDEQRLLQVLGNLISNAAKFTYQHDDVIVSVSKAEDSVTFKVINHGKGLTEEQRQHVFDKFRQSGNTGNHKLPGTGLGLNICKNIVELHNGRIACESVPDVYTCFYFELPVA